MPQLSQLSEVYLSQFFWLAVALGFIFFVIGRGMVPKIQATVDQREGKIAGDLEAAQQARAAADQTEADWRTRMESARSEAARLAQEARDESGRQSDVQVRAAAEQINLKLQAAQSQLQNSVKAAQSEIEKVAAEATREMVTRLAGIDVSADEAARAVKAEIHG